MRDKQKKIAELRTRIGQLLIELQNTSGESERQTYLILLEKTLRKYYDLKQTAGE